MLNCFTFKPDCTTSCQVTAYLQESWRYGSITRRPLPAVVVCPGGGYAYVSPREDFPVGREYLGAGYHVFIMNYSVGANAKNFEPLCQLAATISQLTRSSDTA